MIISTIQDTTVESVLRAQASAGGDRIAIRSGTRSITYTSMVNHAERFARWLIDAGVEPGDRVALWLPNCIPWVTAHVGIAMAGAVSVPVSTRLVEREVAHILTHSRSKVVVTPKQFLDRDYAGEARAFVENRTAIAVVAIDHDHDELPESNRQGPLPGCRPDEPAVVQYTSGTTGFPKGCVLSHRAWTNNARLSAEVAELGADDVVLCPSPFFHLFGSLTGLMGALSIGAPLITMPTFDATACVQAIRAFGATRLVAVPTMWLDLMNTATPDAISSIEGGVWGGAGFPRSALEQAIDKYGWNLQAIYGMTEAPTLTQVRPNDARALKLDSVGRASPAVELRIVDPGTGANMPVGEPGEIWARGYNLMLGYLDDPAATAARTDGEWLRSGDLGTVDAEGTLRVVGRLTDMIVVGGANVYPREVEDVLTAMDGVALAAVVGRSDTRLGEVPVAWVVPTGPVELSEAVILDHCKRYLAGYKIPRQISIVRQIPLTGSGKVHKALLQEWANRKEN